MLALHVTVIPKDQELHWAICDFLKEERIKKGSVQAILGQLSTLRLRPPLAPAGTRVPKLSGLFEVVHATGLVTVENPSVLIQAADKTSTMHVGHLMPKGNITKGPVELVIFEDDAMILDDKGVAS